MGTHQSTYLISSRTDSELLHDLSSEGGTHRCKVNGDVSLKWEVFHKHKKYLKMSPILTHKSLNMCQIFKKIPKHGSNFKNCFKSL